MSFSAIGATKAVSLCPTTCWRVLGTLGGLYAAEHLINRMQQSEHRFWAGFWMQVHFYCSADLSKLTERHADAACCSFIRRRHSYLEGLALSNFTSCFPDYSCSGRRGISLTTFGKGSSGVKKHNLDKISLQLHYIANTSENLTLFWQISRPLGAEHACATTYEVYGSAVMVTLLDWHEQVLPEVSLALSAPRFPEAGAQLKTCASTTCRSGARKPLFWELFSFVWIQVAI